MKLKNHQLRAAKKAKELLAEHNLAYIFGPPRIGKSLIALEAFKDYNSVLVLTKKNAIEGWEQYSDSYGNYKVTNYEKVTKFSPADFDAVIIDEAHNFGAKPRPTLRVKNTKAFCRDKPIVYLSGTPIVESPLGIYHQFYLSSYSPLRFKNFFEFFHFWGVPCLTYLAGRSMETYTKARPEFLPCLEQFIVRVTYEDAEFNYQNYDQVVPIEPTNTWITQFKKIKSSNFLGETPLESASAVYQALHQFEGGVYKDGRVFKEQPKVQWLREFCKENKNKKIAVMSYFIKEQEFLKNLNLPGVTVFSSTKYCEGIDLSHFDFYILFSFGYSGCKFIQLRDRIVNINKNIATYVKIPLIKGGICEQVYNCVSQKKDFNSQVFRGLSLQ